MNAELEALLSAKERECEELKSALAPFCIPGGDNTLEAFADLEPCVVVGLGLVAGDFRKARAACGPVSAIHYRRNYCPAGCNEDAIARAEAAEASYTALLSDYRNLENKMLRELQSMSDKLRIAGEQREAAEAQIARIMEWGERRGCSACHYGECFVNARPVSKGEDGCRGYKPPQAWEVDK